MTAPTTAETYEAVRTGYRHRANHEATPALRARVAAAMGYDPLDLDSVPDAANTGESCGNPLAIANLSEGETLVDLGSGGGLDVLLAAKQVGEKGTAIGIDMTEEMVNLARKNAQNANLTNARFIHSRIDTLPLNSASVDCVVSNCVLNLVPEEDKPRVFSEIYRVLKPGGRLAFSDILSYKPLPNEMKENVELIVGCVGGAVEVDVFEGYLKAAGFQDVLIVDSKRNLNVYNDDEKAVSATPCCAGPNSSCGPTTKSGRKIVDYNLNEWVGSFQIYALKAKQKKSCCGCQPGSC